MPVAISVAMLTVATAQSECCRYTARLYVQCCSSAARALQGSMYGAAGLAECVSSVDNVVAALAMWWQHRQCAIHNIQATTVAVVDRDQ